MAGFFKKLIDQVKKEYPEVGELIDSAREGKMKQYFQDQVAEITGYDTSIEHMLGSECAEQDVSTNENEFCVFDCIEESQQELEGECSVETKTDDNDLALDDNEEVAADDNTKDGNDEDDDIDLDMTSILSDFFGESEDANQEDMEYGYQTDTEEDFEEDIEDQQSDSTDGREEALRTVYRDPADIEMAAETRARINAMIRHNLNARKFLWGTKELIEKAGDYIVEHSDESIDDLCAYIESQSIRYDLHKFKEEFSKFKRESMIHLLERDRIDEYIFLDRMDGEEIINKIDAILTTLHDKKVEKPGFYLRLNRNLIDRDGMVVQSDLFATIYPEEAFVDWESPEVKEYILYQFREKYGHDLYYDQIDRANFDVSRLN